jgi:hypothetical protein
MTSIKQYVILFLIMLTALLSCNPLDNEVKGVSEIISYYGGNCKYAIGVSESTNHNKNQYLELELSNSETIERYIDIPDFPASNIAYLCYKELGESAERYNQIKSVLVFRNGKKVSFTYQISQLSVVAKKMILLNRVIDLIKAHDFSSLKLMLNDNTVIKYNKDTLISSIKKAEYQLGDIKGFRSLGFQFNILDGIETLRISGIIDRTKTSHQFSIDVDSSTSNNQVLSIQYKL